MEIAVSMYSILVTVLLLIAVIRLEWVSERVEIMKYINNTNARVIKEQEKLIDKQECHIHDLQMNL